MLDVLVECKQSCEKLIAAICDNQRSHEVWNIGSLLQEISCINAHYSKSWFIKPWKFLKFMLEIL